MAFCDVGHGIMDELFPDAPQSGQRLFAAMLGMYRKSPRGYLDSSSNARQVESWWEVVGSLDWLAVQKLYYCVSQFGNASPLPVRGLSIPEGQNDNVISVERMSSILGDVSRSIVRRPNRHIANIRQAVCDSSLIALG